jgi:hypothetical protein
MRPSDAAQHALQTTSRTTAAGQISLGPRGAPLSASVSSLSPALRSNIKA